jgi:hypothetical protein
VTDIPAPAAALESRAVTFLQEPAKVHEDAKHELWFAFFQDSEGNNMALMSEVPRA